MPNIPQKNIINLKDRRLFDRVADLLVVDGGVKVTGFGTFKLVKIKAHMGFNPSNGKYEKIEDYYKLTFIPTKKLREKVQSCKR